VKVKTVLGDMSKILILFKHFNMVLLLSVENWCPAKKAVCGKTPLVIRVDKTKWSHTLHYSILHTCC